MSEVGVYTEVYQLRFANVLEVGAEILSQYGRSPGMNEEAKTITWRGPATEQEGIRKIIVADDVPAARHFDEITFLRGRIEELEREGGRIIQALVATSGSQVTAEIVREIGVWGTQANRVIAHRCSVDAAMIQAGFPPEDDRYEKDLLMGYMQAAMGYLHRCWERLR